VDSVSIFPDHLEVKVAGASPLLVELAEVGLRDPGTKSDVSEGRRRGSATGEDVRSEGWSWRCVSRHLGTAREALCVRHQL
jgi:hypothetical protein